VVRTETTRRRLRAGVLLLALTGLLSLGFGLAAPSLAPEVPPVPVPLGEPVPLPATGPFGGTLALYGAANGATRPDLDRLGCRLRTGTGRVTGLSERGAAGLDRRVVEGTALVPLLRIESSAPDWTIACDGPGEADVQPLYLISTTGQRDLVPMAAFSFATLALVLGIAGAVLLRPIDS
jgi:hypothetical protein